MSKRRTRVLAALTGVGALVALSACQNNSTNAAAPANSPAIGASGSSGTVTVATRNVAANLDPALQDDDPSYAYTSAVYDPLVTYDAQTKQYVPDLATSWTPNSAGTVYTFQLRKGVTFHDGSPLTAAGVKDSLERTISIGQGYAYLMDGVSSISAPSQDQLVIKLKTADPAFVGDLTQMFIASDKAVKAHPGKAGESWFASHDAGSGPYELTSYQPSSEIVVSQFKNYWRGWSGNHVKEYDFKVTDPATQVLDLKQGTADVADAVATQQLASLKSSGYSVTMNAGLPFYLALNLESPRLQNVDVRHAIALAVPYEQIIQKVMLGYASRLSGPAPSWMKPVNPAIKPTPTDLATAQKLMSAAGYSSSHPLKLSMIYFNGLPIEQTIATIVQSSLQSIGISLSVTPAPWATLTAEVENPKTRPDIGEVAMSAVTPNIGPLLIASFNPSNQGSWQYWGYNDKQTVSLLDRAQGAATVSEQTSLYQQAEMNLVNQYAAVWLMTDPDVIVTSSSLHNVQQNPAERAFDYYAAYKS